MTFGLTGWGGLVGLIPWIFVYCAMIGSINATAAGLTMQHFGHAAGMASALIGIFLYGGGTIASLLMGAVHAQTPLPMTALMCLFGVSGLLTYLLFRPPAPR
jgi:DHA1 family bicyclomycin/chloramphenicol resistance-like MFS transporter